MTIPTSNGNGGTALPLAVNLSHHLNSLSKARQPSPLKFLFKYAAVPDLLSFAGGEELSLSLHEPNEEMDSRHGVLRMAAGKVEWRGPRFGV